MQAWEELIAQGVKQGPFIAPALPKAEPSTHEQPATDAAEPPAADTNEAEHPPTKAKRSDPGSCPGALNVHIHRQRACNEPLV